LSKLTVTLTVATPKVGEHTTTEAFKGASVELIGWMVAVADPAEKSIPSQIAIGAKVALGGKLEHVTVSVL
jgi:hypothetical protein